MSNEYAVVYAVDGVEKYVSYLVNSLRSLKRCAYGTVDVHVMVNDMDGTLKSAVAGLSGFGESMGFIDCSALFERYDVLNRYGHKSVNLTPMTFARVFVPMVDGLKSYKRVLYVDVDTEFRTSPSDGIFREGMDGFELGMVYDEFPTTRFGSEPQRIIDAKLKSAGYEGGYVSRRGGMDYCNAGVALFNMDMLSTDGGYAERVEEMFAMQERCDFRAKDQDLLNLWFKVKTFPYQSGYNTFYHHVASGVSFPPLIVHYVLESGKAALDDRCSELSKEMKNII